MLQFLHGDVVVGHQVEEALKVRLISKLSTDVVQVEVTLLVATEAILLQRQPGHRTHKVGGRAQPAEGKANAAFARMQPVKGRLLHKLVDQLIDMQVAQSHRDADNLRSRLAHLVDHFLDGHGWP